GGGGRAAAGENRAAGRAEPRLHALVRAVRELRGGPGGAKVRLEEADPADRGQPDDRHDREQRVALLVVADHLAERPRQREWDQQEQEDLEPVGERVRAVERGG